MNVGQADPSEEECEAEFICFLEHHSLDIQKDILRGAAIYSKSVLANRALEGILPNKIPAAVRRKIANLGKDIVLGQDPSDPSSRSVSASSELQEGHVVHKQRKRGLPLYILYFVPLLFSLCRHLIFL